MKVDKGFSISLVLGFVGLASSTFYEKTCILKLNTANTVTKGISAGGPRIEFPYTIDGKKISDDQIKEWLCELVCADGFPYSHKNL